MTVSWKLVLFIGAVSAGFVYICNAIPQIKAEPPAVETTIGESPEALQEAGKRIFLSDRAQCLTCHSLTEDPKARCPNQDGLGLRAGQQRPGMSAAQYLVESVYDPNAYVVPGYPKNQMQPVNKPPIALTHDEILAVISFLNSLGGRTDAAFVEQVKIAQDPWRKGLLKPEAAAVKFRPPIYAGDAERGRGILEREECLSCHSLGGEGRDVCPDLTAIGGSQSAEYILESLLDPKAVIVKGYKEVIVVWKDGRMPLRGRVTRWLPDREHPRAIVLNVEDEGKRVDKQIDLADVATLGDSLVEVDTGEDDFLLHYGEFVSGDKSTGVTLRVLERGGWVEKTIPPHGIDSVGYPTSPMPGDLAQRLTPREIYDLLAYLREQGAQR